jgi:quercetin dioxygenase-like cupin family protein
MNPHSTHYQQHVGQREGTHYKATLFSGDFLMLGVNCLEPGQTQPIHQHPDQDKAYIVMEGNGLFSVGDVSFSASAGEVIWAPAGIQHGAANTGSERLTILVVMAPPPGQ